jgi:hypothetical protein
MALSFYASKSQRNVIALRKSPQGSQRDVFGFFVISGEWVNHLRLNDAGVFVTLHYVHTCVQAERAQWILRVL